MDAGGFDQKTLHFSAHLHVEYRGMRLSRRTRRDGAVETRRNNLNIDGW